MVYTILSLAWVAAGLIGGLVIATIARKRVHQETPLAAVVASIVVLAVFFSVFFSTAQRLQFERYVVCAGSVSRTDRANLRGTLVQLLSHSESPDAALHQLIHDTRVVDRQGQQCLDLTHTGPLGPG